MKPSLPQRHVAIVDEGGKPTKAFHDFLLAFWLRFGGVGGYTEGNVLVGSDEGNPVEVEVGGDATITGGTLTIANGVVTFAKMQDIATDKLLGRATAGTGDVELIDLTAAGRAVIGAADNVEQRVTLGVEIGVDVQAWSANLDEYAAVNPTAAGLALLDDADNTAQRATLGLGTAATKDITTWAAYTPTVTLVGGVGNTVPAYATNEARYTVIDKTCFVEIFLNADGGAEGAGTGQYTVALPVAVGASAPANSRKNIGIAINTPTRYMLLGSFAPGASTIGLTYWDTVSSQATFDGDKQNNAVRNVRLSFFYEID